MFLYLRQILRQIPKPKYILGSLTQFSLRELIYFWLIIYFLEYIFTKFSHANFHSSNNVYYCGFSNTLFIKNLLMQIGKKINATIMTTEIDSKSTFIFPVKFIIEKSICLYIHKKPFFLNFR